MIFWNHAQERNDLWLKKSKPAALINVVLYHCVFKYSGNGCINNLYQLYGVLFAHIFIRGITPYKVLIWAVSDVVQFVMKLVNLIHSFWILSKYGILSFHHIFAESMAESDSAKTKITFKSFHSH
jgi:Na+/alanine symporter